MPTQGSRIPPGQFWHKRASVWHPFKTKHRARKVQGFLHRPDAIVLIWWKYLCRISHCDPADGNCTLFRKPGLDMDHPVDAYFRAGLDVRPIEDTTVGGQEHMVLYG